MKPNRSRLAAARKQGPAECRGCQQGPWEEAQHYRCQRYRSTTSSGKMRRQSQVCGFARSSTSRVAEIQLDQRGQRSPTGGSWAGPFIPPVVRPPVKVRREHSILQLLARRFVCGPVWAAVAPTADITRSVCDAVGGISVKELVDDAVDMQIGKNAIVHGLQSLRVGPGIRVVRRVLPNYCGQRRAPALQVLRILGGEIDSVFVDGRAIAREDAAFAPDPSRISSRSTPAESEAGSLAISVDWEPGFAGAHFSAVSADHRGE